MILAPLAIILTAAVWLASIPTVCLPVTQTDIACFEVVKGE